MHFLSELVKLLLEPLSTIFLPVPFLYSMLAGADPMFENDVSSAAMSGQTVCSGQKTAQLTGERVVCNVFFTSLINIFMNAVF